MPTAHRYFLHALSPLHAGTGQGTGVIDMPIAREKATGIPYLPGSSVKGTLRNQFFDTSNEILLFGPRTENAEDHAGAVQFADARLLLLPVRSLRGTFAWVTSPYILNRFAREIQDTSEEKMPRVTVSSEKACLVSSPQAAILYNNQAVIEDLDLDAIAHEDAKIWAEWIGNHAFGKDTPYHDMVMERLCIVHDDMLAFLLITATEVVARIRLKQDTKTVDTGALWYEESLPVESLLAGVFLIDPPRKHGDPRLKAQEVFKGLQSQSGKTLQFGGKATVGRGLCRVQIEGAA